MTEITTYMSECLDCTDAPLVCHADRDCMLRWIVLHEEASGHIQHQYVTQTDRW